MFTLSSAMSSVGSNVCHRLMMLLFHRFAYIEFADKESVRTAMALDESLFRGRQIKVTVAMGDSV